MNKFLNRGVFKTSGSLSKRSLLEEGYLEQYTMSFEFINQQVGWEVHLTIYFEVAGFHKPGFEGTVFPNIHVVYFKDERNIIKTNLQALQLVLENHEKQLQGLIDRVVDKLHDAYLNGTTDKLPLLK